MLRHIIWFALGCLAVANGGACPVYAQQRTDSDATKPATQYRLTVVHEPQAKFETAIYRLPEIVHARFQTICEAGLLTELVEKGAIVTIQFSRKPLTKKIDPKLLKIGTHVESVKPLQFSPGDKVTITVQNHGTAN